MKSVPPRLDCAFAVALALGFLVSSASGAEILGRVTNGTTGQPVPGQFVNLLALRGQMVPVRETQTNAAGRFRFVVAANPSERFLVQVPFRGVTYSQPAMLTSGEKITADIEVFEADARPQDLSVEAHTVFLDPHRDHVRVSEFYALRNSSRPPRTFAPDGGSFRFALPTVVGDLQVSAGRPGGVSLRQSPQPAEEENTFWLDYPFKPGDTEIQLSYAVPMRDTTLELTLPLRVPASRRHIAVPRDGVRVEGKGLSEIQQNQAPQMRVYAVATDSPADLPLRLEVDPAVLQAAAVAPPPPPAQAASESQVQIVPHPVNRSQWYIMALALFILSLGLYYLYSLRPAPNTANATSHQSHNRPASGGPQGRD